MTDAGSAGPDRHLAVGEALAAIQDSPAVRLVLDLNALCASIEEVVAPNLDELRDHLWRPQDDDELFGALIATVGPRTERDRYLGELLRLLSNYLNSSAALVDHTRRLTTKIEGGYQESLREGVERLERTPQVQVAKGLRNYLAHRSLADLDTVARVGPAPALPRFVVRLSVDGLLLWDGWKPVASAFIRTQETGLDLAEIVDVHGSMTLRLNRWLHGALVEATESHGQEVAKLFRRWNAAVRGIRESEVDGELERVRGLIERIQHAEPSREGHGLTE